MTPSETREIRRASSGVETPNPTQTGICVIRFKARTSRATCDGNFFIDEVVGVVGGGDSALDEALVLTEFASRVIIFHRRDRFRGQKVLQDRVLSHPKIEARWSTVVDAILGDGQVAGVSVTEVTSGETSRVDLSGIFIYVGLEPNSTFLSYILPSSQSRQRGPLTSRRRAMIRRARGALLE